MQMLHCVNCATHYQLTLDGFDADAVADAAANLSSDAREMTSFLTSEYGLAVPKDIALIPFEALQRVADSFRTL